MKLTKKFILWVLVSAAVLLLAPWLAARVVSGEIGLALCLMLFYGAYPIYSFVIGIVSGPEMPKMWLQPVLMTFFNLLGTYLLFTLEDPVFWLLAGLDLLIAVGTMLVSYAVHKPRRKKASQIDCSRENGENDS